ncbi:MAG: hypothetical protein V1916_02795 [Patescibacteria group bacterium]
MIDTTKDLLYLILSLCLVVFTFFLCWALYYIVMMLRRMDQATREVTEFISSLRQKLDRVEGLLSTIEEKIKNSASYLPLVFKGIGELVSYIKRRKDERTETADTKKKK